MAVEIEKPAVSFTDEAQRALQESLLRLERRIRAKAADYAIKTRGTPSEVTASDIHKAYRDLIVRGPQEAYRDRFEDGRKQWRKTANLRLIATFYTWFGALTAICGATYPFIRAKLLDPSFRFSVVFGLCGLFMAMLGVSFRAYLNYREALRKDRTSVLSIVDLYRKPE